MTSASSDDTGQLLEAARAGSAAAREALLLRHRTRLRQMIAVRMDPRLRTRLDPSDVVQEVFVDACRKLPEYLERPGVPFYPWLRQLAWERLLKLHQRHVQAAKRSTSREQCWEWAVTEESADQLAGPLASRESGPATHLLRAELCQRVREALHRLGERDREVLVLRYLEQLAIREIAAILGISEGATKVRHLRALERLREVLGDEAREDES